MDYRVLHGDCIEIMRGMNDRSVDFVWTDPPYNVGKDYGVYKDNLPDSEYLEWCAAWIEEAKRVSGNHMAICPPMKYLREFWWLLGPDYRQIVLPYSPEGACRWGMVNQYVSLLCNVPPIKRTKNVWYNCQIPALGYYFHEETFDHPGYTSLDVTKRVLASFTVQGMLVLDPFCGTGTTAVACSLLGRNFIGIELNEDYIAKIALPRIARAEAQPGLFELTAGLTEG